MEREGSRHVRPVHVTREKEEKEEIFRLLSMLLPSYPSLLLSLTTFHPSFHLSHSFYCERASKVRSGIFSFFRAHKKEIGLITKRKDKRETVLNFTKIDLLCKSASRQDRKNLIQFVFTLL